MVSICEAIRAGDSMENAIKKAESAETTHRNYESLTMRRREAAMLMQVSEETKTIYEGNVRRMRRTLKRNKNSTNVGVRGRNRTQINDEAIDLC